jgi:hypothetical protein
MMKKYLFHIFKYGLIVFIALNAIAWCSLYFLRNSSFYKPQFLTHEVKETSFDYIVIGSSIGLTSLNTIKIDSLTNKKGLNLSIDDTSLTSNYLMLQHFFKQGRKTKFCVLSISYWDLANNEPTLSDNDYRFLPFVSNDYVYQYYKELEPGYFKPLTLSHYFPMFGVSYYNTEVFYPSLIAIAKPNKHNRFDEKGNYFYPELGNVKPRKHLDILLKWNNPYIKKIKQLCDSNATQLIIYQAPLLNATISNTNKEYNFINNADVIDDTSKFFDEIHVNQYGREEASTIFANELLKKYF